MKTFIVTAELANNKEVKSEVLAKALTAAEVEGRSLFRTKEARVNALIGARVDFIAVEEDGTVTVSKSDASDIVVSDTATVMADAKVLLAPVDPIQEFTSIYESDVFISEFAKFISGDVEDAEIVNPVKSFNKFGFTAEMKVTITTIDELFNLVYQYDKNLGSNMGSILVESLNRHGEESIPAAIKALGFYAVIEDGVTKYPYRKIVNHIWENFSISRKLVVAKRKQVLRPKVDFVSPVGETNLIKYHALMDDYEITRDLMIEETDTQSPRYKELEEQAEEILTQARNMKFYFGGGTKAELLGGYGRFTASSESGFTRLHNVDVTAVKINKQVVIHNPLSGEKETIESIITRYVTYDLVDVQYPGRELRTEILLNKIKHEGFAVLAPFGYDGGVIQVEFLLATISKQRTLGGTYCAVKDGAQPFESALAIHKARGTEFLAYASEGLTKDGEVLYTLKGEQRFKRSGLEAASSILVPTINFGNEIKYYQTGTWNEITKEEGEAIGVYDYVLHGGTHTMRVVKIEVKAVVKDGDYLAYNKATESIMKFSASQSEAYWQRFIANDGANAYYSDSIRSAINIGLGLDITLLQGRWANSGKGMALFLPKSEFITTLGDFVVFENNIKGNIEMSARLGHNLQFAVANYAKNPKEDGEVNLPYQMLNGYKDITAEDIKIIFDRGVERLELALTDYNAAMKLIGANLDSFNDEYSEMIEDGLSDEDIEEALAERNFTTVLKEALLTSQGHAFNDGYIKKQLFNFMKKLMRHWMVGAIAVKGEYKFSLQDPLAVVDTLYAYWDGKIDGYSVDGEFFVDVPDNIGTVKAGQVVATVAGEYKVNNTVIAPFKPYVGPVALHRNPQYADVENAYAEAVESDRYTKAFSEGAFNNCVIYSHYDFNLIRQGRQDCDGDRCLFLIEKYFVEYMKANHHLYPALLDITVYFDENGQPSFVDGCPYSVEITDADVPQIPQHLIVSQDKFKIKFTASQYTYELQYWLTKVEIAWALRNLNQNEIGLLTDMGTQIQDTSSLIKECLKVDKNRQGTPFSYYENKMAKGETVDVEKTRAFYQFQLIENEKRTRRLRYAGGWEIDLPKKGGAYKDALRDTFLDFYFNANKYAPIMSYVDKKSETGDRIIIKPLWFDANKTCKTADEIVKYHDDFYAAATVPEHAKEMMLKMRTNGVKSVLDQHLSYAVSRLKGLSYKASQLASGQNHIFSFLSRISYDTSNEESLRVILSNNNKFYRESSTNITNRYNELIALANENKLVSKKEKKEMIRGLEKARSNAFAELTQLCAEILKNDSVVQNSCPIFVGYMAYDVTNTNARKLSAYAWTVAWEFFSKTLTANAEADAVVNREWSYKSLMVNDNRGGKTERSFSFVVPEAVKLSNQDVAKGLAYYGQPLYIKRNKDNDTLYVYAFSGKTNKYVPVGKIVFKEQIAMFNGISEAYVAFRQDKATFGGTSNVRLAVTEMKYKN